MKNIELRLCPNDAKLAAAVAEQWVNELSSLDSEPYCVALSGGRIAKRLFEEISTLVKMRVINLDPVHFFWADERCVPPDHAESNFALAHQALFVPLGICPSRIHRVQGELPPQTAATEAEAEMCQIAPKNADGQPILDLIFLGMGEDGHVASLFPGETERPMEHLTVYRPVVASKSPPQRVTLTYGAIAAAKKVWVLASGLGKETALRESLSPEGRTPLARVLKLRSTTTLFTEIHLQGSSSQPA
jgi:6-phosphogluconolactonase